MAAPMNFRSGTGPLNLLPVQRTKVEHSDVATVAQKLVTVVTSLERFDFGKDRSNKFLSIA